MSRNADGSIQYAPSVFSIFAVKQSNVGYILFSAFCVDFMICVSFRNMHNHKPSMCNIVGSILASVFAILDKVHIAGISHV